VQKLKSFFTLLGVCIGVMFLIAVISIVQGMSSCMENLNWNRRLPARGGGRAGCWLRASNTSISSLR
jgi:hypothetical protein